MQRSSSPLLLVVALVLSLHWVPAAFADNLVQNPGFESGFTSWSESGFGLYGPLQVHGGALAADTGCVGPDCISSTTGAYLQQTLYTIAGEPYDLSFWVAENSGPMSEMAVFWNGNMIADVPNPASDACIGRFTICHFVEYVFPGLVPTGNATVLRINGRQDPGYIIFDDFSVTPVEADPALEPAGVTLMAAGTLAALVVLRRRFKR